MDKINESTDFWLIEWITDSEGTRYQAMFATFDDAYTAMNDVISRNTYTENALADFEQCGEGAGISYQKADHVCNFIRCSLGEIKAGKVLLPDF